MKLLKLLVRRLAEPVVFLAVAAGLLVWYRAVGRSAAWLREDYVAFAVGIAFLFFAVRLLNFLLFDVVFPLRRGGPAPDLLRELSGALLTFVGVALLLKLTLSVRLTGFLATSAVLTAIVALALQETLGNLFSGLAIHLERSPQNGDFVQVGDQIGFVEKMSWRAIYVRTPAGSAVQIPNALAARERLEVFGRGRRPLARTLRVGLPVDVAPRRAMEILRQTASDIDDVKVAPAPVAYLQKLGEYSADYDLYYWLEDFADYLRVDSLVRERLWYRLAREKVALPLFTNVQYQVAGLRPEPPTPPAPAELFDRTAILAVLSAEGRDRIRQRAERLVFHAGETIVRQAEAGSDLYIVERGRLSACLTRPGCSEEELGRLAAGDAFGEFSLLTGEPRAATVRSLTESVLWRIDKEAIGPLMVSNPGLPAALSEVIAGRRARIQEAAERLSVTAGAREEPESILSRIRKFFDLEDHTT